MSQQQPIDDSQQQHIDYSRKWYAMATVAMGIFLATIDASIVNVALPTLVRQLNTDFPTVQWVVLSYMLTVTTLLLSVGRLADMIGKKSIYTAGIVIFTVSSALCGLSWNVAWLIAFRVLQAVGAAMTMALGTAIITESFPPSERGKALGVVGSVVSIGVIAGPALGGILLYHFSWHWIFFVNVPVGIVGTFIAVRFLADIKPEAKDQRFDYPGALTLFVFLISLLLSLTMGQRVGFLATPIIVLMVVAVVFLVMFVVIEWKTSQPMIDLALFQRRELSTGLFMGLLTFVAVTGSILLMPFYLENIQGYNTFQVGMLMAVVPVMLGVSAPISGILSDRIGTHALVTIGLALLITSCLLLRMLDEHTPWFVYVLYNLPIGLGAGIFQSPNNSAIMGSAPRGQLGIVSGMLSISRVFGQTMGHASMGALWGSRVAAHVGYSLEGKATVAPISAQIAALHDTFLAMAILISVALAVSLWGMAHNFHSHKSLAPS